MSPSPSRRPRVTSSVNNHLTLSDNPRRGGANPSSSLVKKIMNKKYIIFTFLFCLFALSSCRDKQEKVKVDSGLPVFEFTNEDSLDISALADQYMGYFKDRDYEGVVHLLYIVSNDSIIPLPAEQAEGFKKAMSLLPIVDCSLKELKLFSDRDNELRIALQISEDGDMETGKGCINFFLNPVEKDGHWFLTLRDEYGEGVGLYHKTPKP